MDTKAVKLVPKVHPATRPVEPEDPMELYATPVAGDPEVMLRCVVQEYAWMGWDGERILGLFRDPFYPALHELLDVFGEAGVRERLDAVLSRTGVMRFTAAVRDEPESAERDDEPELVQLEMPQEWSTRPIGAARSQSKRTKFTGQPVSQSTLERS